MKKKCVVKEMARDTASRAWATWLKPTTQAIGWFGVLMLLAVIHYLLLAGGVVLNIAPVGEAGPWDLCTLSFDGLPLFAYSCFYVLIWLFVVIVYVLMLLAACVALFITGYVLVAPFMLYRWLKSAYYRAKRRCE